MRQIVQFKTEAGDIVGVEINESGAPGYEPASATALVKSAEERFEVAIARIRVIGQTLVAQLRSIADSPDEVTVEFAVKMTAKAGLVIASGEAEANYKVGLKWQRPSQAPTPS